MAIDAIVWITMVERWEIVLGPTRVVETGWEITVVLVYAAAATPVAGVKAIYVVIVATATVICSFWSSQSICLKKKLWIL